MSQMARLTLQLRVDPRTKKREVLIGYESDSDALPMEHEDDHKALVQKVVGKTSASRVQANEGPLEPVSGDPAAAGIEQKS